MYGGVCVCVYVCVFKIKIKREGCNFSRDKMWVWAVSIQGVDISMVTSFTSQRNKELASERWVCMCVFFIIRVHKLEGWGQVKAFGTIEKNKKV